jgi:hypothetical protein
MGTLTAEQKLCEYNRGQKAARDGRSRYWSQPSAYPFESDERYEGRAEAFGRGYDDQFQHNLAEINRNLQFARTKGIDNAGWYGEVLRCAKGLWLHRA